MDKSTILKAKLKDFNINIDDVKPNDDIFGALEEAIYKKKNEDLINRLEVVLNDNLIEVKDKITNCRTIFGARISYDNLSEDISFFLKKDNKPTYEQLEQQVKKQKETIEKVIEYIQNHQLVFRDSTLEETEEWFNRFYIDVLDILKEVSE